MVGGGVSRSILSIRSPVGNVTCGGGLEVRKKKANFTEVFWARTGEPIRLRRPQGETAVGVRTTTAHS